jgi:hypothetical protein
MSAESIVVTENDYSTDRTLYKVADSGYKSSWSESGVALQSRVTMDINHDIKSGFPAVGNDRHTISLRMNALNSASDGILTGSVTVTFSLPRNSGWTNAKTLDLLKMIQCLFKESFITGLESGVVLSGDYSVSTAFVPA